MTTLAEQLRIDEGNKPKIYLDSKNIPTIGVGRNLKDVGLFPDEIELLLQNDIKRAQYACRAAFDNFATLPKDKRDALTNMAFNLGQTKLSEFKMMIAAVEKRDWAEAAAQAKDSDWYKQVCARAVRICAILGAEE